GSVLELVPMASSLVLHMLSLPANENRAKSLSDAVKYFGAYSVQETELEAMVRVSMFFTSWLPAKMKDMERAKAQKLIETAKNKKDNSDGKSAGEKRAEPDGKSGKKPRKPKATDITLAFPAELFRATATAAERSSLATDDALKALGEQLNGIANEKVDWKIEIKDVGRACSIELLFKLIMLPLLARGDERPTAEAAKEVLDKWWRSVNTLKI